MKKLRRGTLLRSVLMALMLVPIAEAGAQSFNVGDNVLSAGIGVGGYYRAYASYSFQMPSVGLSYERGIIPLGPGVLGVGGFIGFKSLGYRSRVGPGWGNGGYYNEYNADRRWNYLMFGARGAWHYNEWHGLAELDTYAGAMLSFHSINYVDRTPYPAYATSYYNPMRSTLGFSIYIGGRYYFAPRWAGQLELGYGVSVINLGLAYKF